MSTKIYEGLKLRKNMTFFEVNELLRKIRTDCEAIQENEYNKKIANMITSFVDDSLYLDKDALIKMYEIGEKETFNPFLHILRHEKELENEHLSQRPHCDIFLFPVENEVLCLVFGDTVFDNLFYTCKDDDGNVIPPKYPEFEEFGYWNNSESPDNISEEEWEKRRKLWNEALKGIGVPVENGIGKTLVSKNDVFESDEIEIKHAIAYYEQNLNALRNLENSFFAVLLKDNRLPSKDKIIENIADNGTRLESLIKKIIEREFEQQYSKNQSEEKFSYSHFIKSYRTYRDSTECQIYKDELRTKYQDKIKEINPEWVKSVSVAELYK